MRLPKRYQTRPNYAAIMTLLTAPWCLFLAEGWPDWFPGLWAGILLPMTALLAWLCWPGEDRDMKIMALSASVVVVGMSLCAGLLAAGLSLLAASTDQPIEGWFVIWWSVMFPVLALIFAPLFTLGLPYMMAIAGAALFREEKA